MQLGSSGNVVVKIVDFATVACVSESTGLEVQQLVAERIIEDSSRRADIERKLEFVHRTTLNGKALRRAADTEFERARFRGKDDSIEVVISLRKEDQYRHRLQQESTE